jgi:hypothetical protein
MFHAHSCRIGEHATCWCLAGLHYVQAQGELIFEKGETEKDILVQILKAELDLHFKVVLFDVQNADMNRKRSVCDVYFAADRKVGMVMRMVHSMLFRQDVARANGNAWLEQFKEAIIPGQTWVSDPADIASKLQEAKASLQPIDYILHCISIPWKVRPPICLHEAWRDFFTLQRPRAQSKQKKSLCACKWQQW